MSTDSSDHLEIPESIHDVSLSSDKNLYSSLNDTDHSLPSILSSPKSDLAKSPSPRVSTTVGTDQSASIVSRGTLGSSPSSLCIGQVPLHFPPIVCTLTDTRFSPSQNAPISASIPHLAGSSAFVPNPDAEPFVFKTTATSSLVAGQNLPSDNTYYNFNPQLPPLPVNQRKNCLFLTQIPLWVLLWRMDLPITHFLICILLPSLLILSLFLLLPL